MLQADEIEEQLTQPVKTVGGFGHTIWSPGSIKSRPSLSQTCSTYSGDVAAGRSNVSQSAAYYSPSREQEKDEMRAHSSVSSSYLGTVRGVGNYEDNSRASPSWPSHSSGTQPYTSSSWRTYGSSGDDSFGKARYRSTVSGKRLRRINEMNISECMHGLIQQIFNLHINYLYVFIRYITSCSTRDGLAIQITRIFR